jgi:hypothetical protein
MPPLTNLTFYTLFPPPCRRLLVVVDVLRERLLPLADNLNIPESGDGVPDLLNEALWGVKWMMKMQRADGGVYNKVASELWESGSPEGSDLGGQFVRFLLPRTTHDTATAGAVFAMSSRVIAAYDATLSAQLLNHAKLSWSFLQNHSTDTPAGGPVNPPGNTSPPPPPSPSHISFTHNVYSE